MATVDSLNAIREMQAYMWPKPTPGATAPDFCLAAATFLTGKLAGLFQTSQHLNSFTASREARSIKSIKSWEHNSIWGKLTTLSTLNRTVLPVAIKWGGLKPANFRTEFVHQWGNPIGADNLLEQGVPLVVGVSLHDTGSRDHFIVLVKDRGQTWAVDSWGERGSQSAVQLDKDFTFTLGQQIPMNGGPHTVIPCSKPFFGYYREVPGKSALKLAVPL